LQPFSGSGVFVDRPASKAGTTACVVLLDPFSRYRTEQPLSATIDPSSLDYASPENQSDRGYFGVSPESWVKVLVISGLFSAVFWPNLHRLWLKTNPFTGEANWSHAICVPVIGLYYLFVHREDLIKARGTEFIWGRFLRPGRAIASVAMIAVGILTYLATKDHNGIALSIVKALGLSTGTLGVLVLMLDWSIATMLFGLGMFEYGIYPGQNDYLKDLGMVGTLFGIVLLLNGWKVMRIAWFPIVFLICAIPWPGLVYSWVAEPLSTLAAHVAVDVLKATGVDSVNSGTKIIIMNADVMKPPRILNVAEACAGMRSLMTFIAVAGAVAFLSPRPLWQKVIVVASAVPIAIFCNVMRISGQGLLDHYVSPEWSESFAHQFVGMMMLLPAFFLILGVGYVLDMMFIEEADEGEAGYPVTPKAAAIAVRDSAIPAAGVMSAIAAPVAGVAPVALRMAPVASNQPTVTASPKPSASPTTPPRPAAIPARPMMTPPRPGIIPPRPMTAANPGPRSIPAAGPGTQRAVPPKSPTPPRPFTPANRPPAIQPNAMQMSAKPKETP
jgi:exosortase